jgi:hypothetical protein
MSEPVSGTSARHDTTRAVTPPNTSQNNANNELATTPERIRQVELNRLRGRRFRIIVPIHRLVSSVVVAIVSLFSFPSFLILTRGCKKSFSFVFFFQPRQGNARRRRSRPRRPLLHPRATPTTKGLSLLLFPLPPVLRRARQKIMRVVVTNYSAMRVSGNTLIMISQRWSTRRAASSSRTTRKRAMMQRLKKENARDKGPCKISILVRIAYFLHVHLASPAPPDMRSLSYSHLPRSESKPQMP